MFGVSQISLKATRSTDPLGCVVVLPGRGLSGRFMMNFCNHMCLSRSHYAVLRPRNYTWYAMPRNSLDQAKTVATLPESLESAEAAIKTVQAAFGLSREKVALFGFSAGGVMVTQLVIRSETPYAAAVCMGGAIFEPAAVPPAKNKTPIIVQHNRLDECFDWHERYLPMKDALASQGYAVEFQERPYGGHSFYTEDAVNVGGRLADQVTLGDAGSKRRVRDLDDPFSFGDNDGHIGRHAWFEFQIIVADANDGRVRHDVLRRRG